MLHIKHYFGHYKDYIEELDGVSEDFPFNLTCLRSMIKNYFDETFEICNEVLFQLEKLNDNEVIND